MYNGNISEMRWDAGTPKGYGFTYDGANRLKSSDYADGSSFTSNQNRYNTSYGYDSNGNLSSLSRYLNATQIDNLTYAYISSGNRLQSVNDATGNSNGYDDNDGTYIYDNNGNLGYDPSKGTNIYYNYLNLPEQVQFGANDNLRYTYDAAGNKLVKVVDGNVAENNTRLDYSGNFLFENGDLKAIFTSVGRIVPFDNGSGTIYKFEYNLQDHLGNTRVVFSGHSNGRPEVMQVTDYYPFGMVMNQQNYSASGVLSNKYLYNGKELQDDEIGGVKLDWYDYGARFYDAELGRWHSVDPSTETYYSWTPYNYCANNPIVLIDPTGMDWYEDKNGNSMWRNSSDGTYTDDDGNEWTNAGTERTFMLGNKAFYFGQNTDENGNLSLFSKSFSSDDASARNGWLGEMHSDKSRSASENYWGEPTLGNFLSFAGNELAAQWTDPELLANGLMIAIGGYIAMSEAALARTGSLGEGRIAVKQWLQNAGNLERGELIQSLESAGFKRMSPSSSPVSVFERGGMRIRLDPPQSRTPFNHMHLEYGGNSYDILLNSVNYKSPAAHIPIR
jgi:RHS repeat-associated protein